MRSFAEGRVSALAKGGRIWPSLTLTRRLAEAAPLKIAAVVWKTSLLVVWGLDGDDQHHADGAMRASTIVCVDNFIFDVI